MITDYGNIVHWTMFSQTVFLGSTNWSAISLFTRKTMPEISEFKNAN